MNLKFYRALAQIESGERDNKRGAAGERGRFQIRPATWRRYAPRGLAHDKAVNPLLALDVARKYCGDVEEKFIGEVAKFPSAAQMYCMYNMGFAGFKRRGFLVSKCPRAVQERAERFANLVTDPTF